MSKNAVPTKSRKKTGRGRPLLISRVALKGKRTEHLNSVEGQWGEIAWELNRAKTVDELRKALYPIRDRPGIAFFVSDVTTAATGESLRAKREDLNSLAGRSKDAYQEERIARDRLDRVVGALLDSGSSKLLNQAYEERNKSHADSERYSLQLQSLIVEMTEEVRRMESFISQSELLKFIKSKRYSLTPLSVANAMAGLPFITWRQSMRRCLKMPSKLGLVYEVYQDLTIALRNSPRTSKAAIDQVKRHLLYGHSRPSHSIVKLRNEWYFLCRAIEAINFRKVPKGALPYRVGTEYLRLASSRSSFDQVLQEERRLQI